MPLKTIQPRLAVTLRRGREGVEAGRGAAPIHFAVKAPKCIYTFYTLEEGAAADERDWRSGCTRSGVTRISDLFGFGWRMLLHNGGFGYAAKG